MDLVISEIKTFNKGLNSIRRPYWLISLEIYNSGLNRLGSVVVAFPIEEQANKVIKNRLFIAGISAKVVKYRSISNNKYKNYRSFANLERFYKKDSKYILYASPYIYIEYYYTIYKLKGKRCIYLTPKYINYNSTSYLADLKLYKVFLALKTKPNKTSNNTTTTDIPIIIINK